MVGDEWMLWIFSIYPFSYNYVVVSMTLFICNVKPSLSCKACGTQHVFLLDCLRFSKLLKLHHIKRRISNNLLKRKQLCQWCIFELAHTRDFPSPLTQNLLAIHVTERTWPSSACRAREFLHFARYVCVIRYLFSCWIACVLVNN